MPDDERRRPEPESVFEQILRQLVKSEAQQEVTNTLLAQLVDGQKAADVKLDTIIEQLIILNQQAVGDVFTLSGSVDPPVKQ